MWGVQGAVVPRSLERETEFQEQVAGGKKDIDDMLARLNLGQRRKKEVIIPVVENQGLLEEEEEEEDDEFEEEDDDDDFSHVPWQSLKPPTKHPESSPFSSQHNEQEGGKTKPFLDFLEFTETNVDSVLDTIRPALQSDGGDVAISHLDLQTRSVFLILKGACGTCPSQTVTMRNGIEVRLRERFEGLGEVVNMTGDDMNKKLTLEDVELKLAEIEGAVKSLGGTVPTVVTVDDEYGIVKLSFRGPNKVKIGVEMAVGDMKGVNKVVFV